MPQRSRITSWPFLLLAVALLSCLFLGGGQAATPEKPFADLQEGDSLTAAWLMGTFNTIYNWSQTASSTLNAHATNHTNHVSATAAHGATGAVVGTTNTQSLTNKTLGTTNSVDGGAIKSGTVADARIDAAICRDSELTTHGNLTAAHGATGAVVGTTNAQTLTNKTLTSPTINDGTTNLDGGVLILPQTTNPTQTAEGSIVWDTDHEVLTVGTVAGRVTIVSTTDYQAIKDKNLDSSNSIAAEAIDSGIINMNRLDDIVVTEPELSTVFDLIAARIWPVANGGTGATTAATARTNLGVAYGTTAGTVCQGNDSRLSDARTPTAHALVSHTASGLTAGHFLKATGATTFGFAAHGLTYTDVGAAASAHTHNYAGSASAGGAATSALTAATATVALSANAIRTSAPASPADGDIWVE